MISFLEKWWRKGKTAEYNRNIQHTTIGIGQITNNRLLGGLRLFFAKIAKIAVTIAQMIIIPRITAKTIAGETRISSLSPNPSPFEARPLNEFTVS